MMRGGKSSGRDSNRPRGRACRVLVVSKYRVSGGALCRCLSDMDGKYEIRYASCIKNEDLPDSFWPDIVLVTCLEQCPAGPPAFVSLFPKAECIVLARAPDLPLQLEWIKEGVHGIVDESLEGVDLDELGEAIVAVQSGMIWAPREVLSLLVLDRKPPKAPVVAAELLTRRERQTVGLLHLGLSNAEIAERLFISEKTVKGHLTRIYRKLKVANRIQATLKTAAVPERSKQQTCRTTGDLPPLQSTPSRPPSTETQ